MDGIPEDIKRAAVSAHAGWAANLKAAYLPTVREQEFFFLRHVEAAILAERERAAKVVEGYVDALGPEYTDFIAGDIRTPTA